MMEKIMVRTKERHPLYNYLIDHTNGKPIKWNFAKFLISPTGEIIKRFEPKEIPEEIEPTIKEALNI